MDGHVNEDPVHCSAVCWGRICINSPHVGTDFLRAILFACVSIGSVAVVIVLLGWCHELVALDARVLPKPSHRQRSCVA